MTDSLVRLIWSSFLARRALPIVQLALRARRGTAR
jgi:hypothetical protein